MNTVLQNPESVGTIFKTLSARVRSAKTELEELGEEEDEFTQSTSKLRDLIKGLTGFDILESDEQTFKSIYDILLGIGEKWNDLTDVEQASLGEALAGKRNANALYAIINNLDTLKSAYETATDSAGSAMREQQNFEQGLEYSTNRFKASLEELAADTLNSDFLKGGIDAVNTLVQLFDKLISSVGTLSTLAAGLGAIFGGKVGLFSGSSEGLMFGGKTFGENKENKVYRGNLKTLSNNLENAIKYDPNTLMSSFSEEGLALWLGGIDKVDARTKALFDTYRTGGKTAQEALEAVQLELGKVGKASGKFASTLKGLFSSLGAGLLNAAISFGISKLIEGAVSAVDHLINRSKYIQQAAEESRSRIDEVNASLTETTDLVDTAKTRYIELAKEVGNLGSIAQNQGTLSNDEYREFLDISNQLAEKFPQLTQGYTDNGDAILKLSGDVDTIVGSLDELVKAEQQLANQKIADELDNLWDGYVDNIDTYEKKIDKLRANVDIIDKFATTPNQIVAEGTGQERDFLKEAAEMAGLSDKLDKGARRELDGDIVKTLTLDYGALSDGEKEAIEKAFASLRETYIAELNSYGTTIVAEGQKLGNYFATWAKNMDVYEDIADDETLRNLFNSLIQNFDYKSIDGDVQEVKNKLALEINKVFAGLDVEEYQKLRDEIFDINGDAESPFADKVQLLNEKLLAMSTLLGGLDVEKLKTLLGLDSTYSSRQDVLSRYTGQKAQKTGGTIGAGFIKIPEVVKTEAYSEYEDFINSLNDKDFDLWKGALNDGNISDELYAKGRQAWEDYLATLQQVADDNQIEVKVKASDAVDSMADAKSAFNSLESLYDQIVNKTETDGQATGFADPALINSVESAFSKFVTDDDAGQQLNDALENFEKTLVEFPNDAEKAQDAVDELVTAYIDQTDIIKNLTEENAEWSKAQLKAMGITNADEVVQSRLNKTSKKLSEGISKLTESFKTHADVLVDTNKGSQEYEEAMKEMATTLADMLSIEGEDGSIIYTPTIDSSFIESHRADIEAMCNGDIEALNRVRQAAAKAAIMTIMVDMPTEAAEQQINRIMDMVAQADAMNIDVGASIDDSAFIAALQNMMSSSQTTANAVSKAFESMGYNVEWTPHPYTVEYLEANQSNIKDSKAYEAMMRTAKAQVNVPSLKITRAGTAGAKANYVAPSGGNTSGGGGGGGGGGSDNTSEPNKPKEESEETFDWIEVALQRLQEAEERLSKVVSNTYDIWSKRNNALEDEINNVTDQIKAQEKAQDHYRKYAESLQVNGGKGLNDDDYGENDAEVKANDQRLLEEAIQQFDAYKQKVREGLIGEKDIETIQNHFLSEAISNYKTWFEKSVQAGDAVQDLKIKLGDLAKTRFDNVKSEFDGLISLIEAKAGIVDKRIDKAEARAYFAEEKYYKQLISYNDQIYEKQITEYNNLIEKRDQAVAEGSIKKGSEAWNQMTEEIYNTKQAIIETTNSTIEYQNTLRQLKWDKWDWTQERVSRLADEIEFLNELIANEKMYEEDGQYTDYGQARQGMYLMQYNALIDKLHEYKDEYEEVQKALEKDPGNKTLVERYETLQDVIWDTTKSIEGLQQSIKEHMVEAINTHLQYLDKLIEKYETALDKEKDIFSYQKNIKSQVDNISHLERTLNALSGDDSEEARRLRQTTQAELDKAKEQLEETEWDRMISNTKEAIADMRDSYEETLMKGMDNIHEVIERAITEAQANTGKITDCITSTAKQYHYEPSENLQEILDETVTRSDEDYYGVAAEIIKKGPGSSWGATSTAQDKNLRDRGFDSERVRAIIAEMQKERKYTDDMSSVYAGIAYEILKKGNEGSFWGSSRNNQIANLSKLYGDEVGQHIDVLIDAMKGEHKSGTTWAELAKEYGFNLDYKNYQTKWAGASLAELGKKYGFDAKKLGEYSKNNYQGGYKDPANYGWELVEDFETAWSENGIVPQKMQEMRNDLTKIIELTQKQLDLENAQIEADIAYERQKQQEQNDTSRVNADAFRAKGSKYIPHKELAVTQEDGSELIFRASDGSMLTPLGQGDMVFSNEMSQRLWEIAKNGVPSSVGSIKPVISGNAGNTINQENAISITLPNVTNYDEFKNALRKDTQFTNFVQEITVGQLAGNNTLRKNRY